MKYELTVDAKGNWAICEEGAGDVIADLMTKEVEQKLCDLVRADDIEDVLNDVFARNMPFLSTQLIGDIDEELGMGFGKDGTIILPNETYYVDCQNKELEDVYLPPSYPRPFVKPRTTKEYNKMVDDHITERINKVKPFDGMDAETVYNKLKKNWRGRKGRNQIEKIFKATD